MRFFTDFYGSGMNGQGSYPFLQSSFFLSGTK
jgi:hypothetical protein